MNEGLDENLHPSTKTKDQMKRALLLDAVIRKSAAVLELLSDKDEPLLVLRLVERKQKQNLF